MRRPKPGVHDACLSARVAESNAHVRELSDARWVVGDLAARLGIADGYRFPITGAVNVTRLAADLKALRDDAARSERLAPLFKDGKR